MAKFYGVVGYEMIVESEPGVFISQTKERHMTGDVLHGVNRYEQGSQMHDDIKMNQRISVIGDDFAFANYGYIKYVVLHGIPWKVTAVELKRPRIFINFGGIYNV